MMRDHCRQLRKIHNMTLTIQLESSGRSNLEVIRTEFLRVQEDAIGPEIVNSRTEEIFYSSDIHTVQGELHQHSL
ncbi:hypothetical protein AAFF_G00011730 [Aldrovandia affinis]|uniref:Uncharacterized protein n=1 Tax=Aldrovandia affinis TaxID=143900 RepID=A0AAD7S6E3_9TELE|nr:hypothetical protein AAFF_G00011730 [Aldrovandia affinis]